MASRTPTPTTSRPIIIQWLLDTRPLWPVSANLPPREQVQELKTAAAKALALLTTKEQESVLKYYHVKDAKMSLASSLLKHLVITKYCNVPWSKSEISRDANGKPCYTPSPGSTEKTPIDFNVSHQAGLVSLIASIGFKLKVEVGTDVVCANERLKHDYDFVEKQGFFSWVDMHGDVFAKSELQEMKLSPVILDESIVDLKLQGYGRDQISRCQHRNLKIRLRAQNEEAGEPQVMDPIDSNLIIDAKLRRFYAFWCLREAYVKMTGEALLAPWLGDLEFKDIHPPAAKQGLQHPESLVVGDIVKKFDIFFKHRPVRNVHMELTALGQHFMVAGAVRATQEDDDQNFALGVWEQLDLDRDILNFAASGA